MGDRTAAFEAVFKPVQPPTTFEETVERLGTAIRLGLLPPGSRLPPEREAAEQLGIARSPLRPRPPRARARPAPHPRPAARGAPPPGAPAGGGSPPPRPRRWR